MDDDVAIFVQWADLLGRVETAGVRSSPAVTETARMQAERSEG